MVAQQRLGQLLVDMGFISESQLGRALEIQLTSGKRLGKVLVEAGMISEDRLVHALSRQLEIEACDPIMTPVHEAVLALIPAEVAFRHRVLPVARQREVEGESLYVATADPLDADANAALQEVLPPKTELRFMLAGETEMDLALARHYGSSPIMKHSSVPSGTPVIQGQPIQKHPPEAKTTGDIFAALRQAVDEAIPDPSIPVAPNSSGDVGVQPEISDPPVYNTGSGVVLTASGDLVPSARSVSDEFPPPRGPLELDIPSTASLDLHPGSVDLPPPSALDFPPPLPTPEPASEPPPELSCRNGRPMDFARRS